MVKMGSLNWLPTMLVCSRRQTKPLYLSASIDISVNTRYLLDGDRIRIITRMAQTFIDFGDVEEISGRAGLRRK